MAAVGNHSSELTNGSLVAMLPKKLALRSKATLAVVRASRASASSAGSVSNPTGMSMSFLLAVDVAVGMHLLLN